MQLNWLCFCDIYQMMPLKVWPKTALGCNHQSICMPQLQPLCSAALVLMYYPWGMKARVSPVQWSKPHSILATTQDSNPGAGGRIQNHKWWPLHYHCRLVTLPFFEKIPFSHHQSVVYPWECWNQFWWLDGMSYLTKPNQLESGKRCWIWQPLQQAVGSASVPYLYYSITLILMKTDFF